MSEDIPKGLWQASFELPAAPALPVLESLEDISLSVSIFESESDDFEQTTRWRAELLLEDRPIKRRLEQQIDKLLKPQRLKAEAFKIDFLAHEDWLAKAAMPREPLEIGRFFIHGEGEAPPAKPNRIPIAIDAGMAFGSGEHSSTAGCLLAFHELLRRNKFSNVLDMGCGSAILAIAAAKTGTKSVIAADNDPLAVDIARRNCRTNIASTRIRCIVSDGYANPTLRRHARFDLVFANILADPLCAMAPGLKRHLAPAGYAILAGLLDRQAENVIAAHRGQGLRLVTTVDLSPWRTLVLKRAG